MRGIAILRDETLPMLTVSREAAARSNPRLRTRIFTATAVPPAGAAVKR